MPITLKTATMGYKDPTTGQYVGINSVNDADLAEQVQAVEDSIAPDYADLVFPVAAGQKCYHENALYEANQAIPTSEVWTAAHWTALTLEQDISAIKNALNQSNAATNSDIGKAHSPKTVVDGKVTEWQYIEIGGDASEIEEALKTDEIYEKIDLDSISHIGFVTAGANATLTEQTSGNQRYTDPITLRKGQTLKFKSTASSDYSTVAVCRNADVFSTPYSCLIRADTSGSKTVIYTAPQDVQIVLSYSKYYSYSAEIYGTPMQAQKDSFEYAVGAIFNGGILKFAYTLVQVTAGNDYIVVLTNELSTNNSVTIYPFTSSGSGAGTSTTYQLSANEVKTVEITAPSTAAYLRIGSLDSVENGVNVLVCPKENYFANAGAFSTLQNTVGTMSGTVNGLVSDLDEEETARQSADEVLDLRIDGIENEIYEVYDADTSKQINKTVPEGATKALVSDVGEETIHFKQIFPVMDTTKNGLTYTTNSETGWISVSGTSSANTGYRPTGVIPLGHKAVCLIETDGITLQTTLANGFEVVASKGPGYGDGSIVGVYTSSFLYSSDDFTWGVALRCGKDVAISGSIRLQFFDLTDMFGVGNEPTSVAQFLEIFTADYYPYNSTSTDLTVSCDSVLLNGVEQTEMMFAVEEGDVITIHTVCDDASVICPVGSTINYYKSRIPEEEPEPEYIAESAGVTTDLLNESADLRIMLFTDNHDYTDFKYKKYADMMSHGIVDYLVGLGDYKDYSTSHDKIWYKEHLLKALTEAGREANCLFAIGNHDVGIKGVQGAPNSADYLLSPKECYDVLSRHYSKNPSIVYDADNPTRGYGYYYVDNEAAKVRMIFLNSSDIFQSDGSFVRYVGELMFISQQQLTWFAHTACKLDGKEDPSKWAIIVFCHWAYPYGGTDYTLFKILAAVKAGTSITREFTVYNRQTLENGTWTTTRDEVNGDTLSIDEDYSSQGAIDVLGIVFGHNHSDETITREGINALMVRCDNGNLDNYYLAPVSNYTAGTYYFTDVSGQIWSYTITSDYPTCAYIGYNRYFTDSSMQSMPISRYDSNKNRIGSNGSVTRVDTAPTGATEITGFVSERGDTRIGKESAEILCIDRVNRTMTFIPYGTASKRTVSF